MAEAKSVNAPAMVGIMVAYVLIFSPCVLLIFGWMQWWRVRPPRNWRNYAIAWGLATASISAFVPIWCAVVRAACTYRSLE
jgi:hypothetical protein